MDLDGSLSLITIVVILVVVVISGPVLPQVDFTTYSITSAVSDNDDSSLMISGIEVADIGPRIIPGPFEGQAILDVPSVSIRVEHVTGSPLLIYEVAVANLGHNIATLVAFREQDAGRTHSVDIKNSTLRTREINASSYPAELRIRIRTGNESTTVFRKNVTVIVEGFEDD